MPCGPRVPACKRSSVRFDEYDDSQVEPAPLEACYAKSKTQDIYKESRAEAGVRPEELGRTPSNQAGFERFAERQPIPVCQLGDQW